METSAYLLAWSVYLFVAFPICIIAWLKVFKPYLWREFAYLSQGFLIAIVFTPWYVLADQEILAPAIIIFVMDTITISSTEGIRALIPLIMSLLLVIIVTIILSIIYRYRKRKKRLQGAVA